MLVETVYLFAMFFLKAARSGDSKISWLVLTALGLSWTLLVGSFC